MNITGAARVAGVVGWPLAHSLSPLIHNAWIEALGLDAAYVPFAVPPQRFAAFVDGLRGGIVVGLNVTVPHKLAAFRLADHQSPETIWPQAANVLLIEGRALVARNTDGEGLLVAIDELCPAFDWRVAPVVVIGAGGAASVAISTLRESGAPEVRIVARRPEAAARWGGPAMGFRVYGLMELATALDGAQLVVNATPVGLNGAGELPPTDTAPPGAVFMDMVYKPLRTSFLEQAAARGHPTVDGLAMLVGQARPSFEAFFGVAPPSAEVVDVRALCLRALGQGA